MDISKPYAEDSYFEIERATLKGRAHATCGGRSLNDDVMDTLFTLLINAENGPRISDGTLKKGDPVLVQGELRTGEYTDEKKVTRQTVELVAQTILRIDYTKIGVAEQGDAAEPEA